MFSKSPAQNIEFLKINLLQYFTVYSALPVPLLRQVSARHSAHPHLSSAACKGLPLAPMGLSVVACTTHQQLRRMVNPAAVKDIEAKYVAA